MAFLHNGEISLIDTPENIKTQQSTSSISLLLRNNRKVVVQKDEAGAKEIYNYIKDGEILTIHSDEPTLGDVFVKLTGGNYHDLFI